ncbi:hypothetical protein [Dermatobacter hominis]|uniref:hypothetical protein n=1 Tax=Dermatobacter hominis TaxID=2884263 RepID=UPI001D1166E0|nr:hypothetical protein [Dermatobacter hominis]UDY34809.1 hypothetical protein LH044_15885 [Dermatobacter hominis]
MTADDRAALAVAARDDLVGRLDALLGDRLRLEQKRPRDGAGWVDVSAHDLALVCPSRWSVPFDDFVVTAATAAGAIGRVALRERRDGEPVGVAVDRVLTSVDDLDRDAAWFADWYEQELDRAGRAAVRAAATTWATGALAAVAGRPLSWATRRQLVDVPERTIRLRANWDASDGVSRPDVLVVMSARAPSDPALGLLAGFNALADGLLRRQVPARVRVGSPATASTVAFPVTADLLARAVERVVELVRWRAEPDAAPTSPGRWCRDCHLLDVCPDAGASVG